MNKDEVRNLIVTAFPVHGAGSGALVTTQAISYVKNGYPVAIITANNRDDFPKVDGVKYHVVPFSSEKEGAEKLEGAADFNYLMFTTHTESTATFWNSSLEQIKQYEGMFRNAIKEEIEEFKPTFIHAQHNWISSSIATEFDLPVVLTIHGTDLMGYERSKSEMRDIKEQLESKEVSDEDKKGLKEKYEKYKIFINHSINSAKNSNKIIVISEAQKQKFEELFPFAKDKVELVKNGYNPEVFYVEENVDKEEVFSKLTSDRAENGKIDTDFDKMVLFVGKFAGFKGIDVMLDAAKDYEEKMEEKGQKVLTVLVGTGSLEKDLKEQAEKLQLKNTHFVGLQNHDTIRNLQNLADVSLIPSRDEPFGLVVIEGTACGHPVIATNGGGIPDILNTTGKKMKKEYNEEIDGKNSDILKPDEGTKGTYTTDLGMLVPIDDSKSLANAVVSVLDGEKKFDNKHIAEYTKENYSQEEITKRLINLFENTINEKNNEKDVKKNVELPSNGGDER